MAELYTIYTPNFGFLNFKKEGDTYTAVDNNGNVLTPYRYDFYGGEVIGTSYTITESVLNQLGWTAYKISKDKIDLFKKPVLKNGVSTVGTSYEKTAITENADALALYLCFATSIPSFRATANATWGLNCNKLATDKQIIREDEENLQLQKEIEDLINTIKNSRLYKLMKKWWVHLIIGLVDMILAVIALIPEFGIFISAALHLILGLALSVTVGVFFDELKNSISDLGEKYNEDATFNEIVDNFEKNLTTAEYITIASIVVSSIFKGIFTLAHPASQITPSVIIPQLLKQLLNETIGNTLMYRGYGEMAQSLADQLKADTQYALSMYDVETQRLQAESDLWSKLIENMQSTLENLVAYMEMLIQSSSELIKTLGEGSRSVTQNLVI